MRQQGYKVTIKGFLPVDKSDLQAQKSAIDALLAGNPEALIELLSDVEIEHQMTSRQVDEPEPKVAPPLKKMA